MNKGGYKVNIPIYLAVLLLSLTMFSTYLLGGMYAKFTTSATGSDSARVAKYAFAVSDKLQQTLDGTKITLFAPIEQAAQNNVTDGMLAPGSSGQFLLTVSTEGSETAVELKADITAQGVQQEVPLRFAIAEAKPASDSAYTLEGLSALAADLTGRTVAPNTTEAYQVYWKWVDENTDEANARDTKIGQYLQQQAPQYHLTINITGAQAD